MAPGISAALRSLSAPNVEIVGRFDMDGESYVVVRSGPHRLKRDDFNAVVSALKLDGEGSWWRERQCWILTEKGMTDAAMTLREAFPEERAA